MPLLKKKLKNVKIAFAVINEGPRGDAAVGPDAYDVLRSGLDNTARLREIFEGHKKRFTFFPAGAWLEYAAQDENACMDELMNVHGGFPIGNCTYSYKALKPANRCEAMEEGIIEGDIRKANDIIKQVLGIKPTGFADPRGYSEGFLTDNQRNRKILQILDDLGFKWCNADTRGDYDSPFARPVILEGRWRQPFRYGNGMVEIPSHGWDDTMFLRTQPQNVTEKLPQSEAEIIDSFTGLYTDVAGTSATDGLEDTIYLLARLHPGIMYDHAAGNGGYTDKNLGVWETVMEKTLDMGVGIIDIEDIYDSVTEQNQ